MSCFDRFVAPAYRDLRFLDECASLSDKTHYSHVLREARQTGQKCALRDHIVTSPHDRLPLYGSRFCNDLLGNMNEEIPFAATSDADFTLDWAYHFSTRFIQGGLVLRAGQYRCLWTLRPGVAQNRPQGWEQRTCPSVAASVAKARWEGRGQSVYQVRQAGLRRAEELNQRSYGREPRRQKARPAPIRSVGRIATKTPSPPRSQQPRASLSAVGRIRG
ncbi:hypothetical protein B0H13DRAFT_2524832 [Mycena leptocephala]|nr:hypothetical protein B0H13DRAFT_2524832 [Mycena leptocephala]